MIAIQRHRGPDGEGFFNSAGVSLGHCRLAIIDRSETGRQPMGDHRGRYWVTYNGEIYNYLELSKELTSLGYRFRGHSDTEVLLAAFDQWGEACLERLRGMFAFAIWDERERSLFAARDRLGIKPFHYWTDGDRQLAFSSELKALLTFLPQRVSNLSLARVYLAWGLVDHEPSDTMVNGIHRLPAGHAMRWRSGEGLKLWRYWQIRVSEDLDGESDQKTASIPELRRRFEETIALHLRSDVPVGTCLSGGLDSSAIVCVVDRLLRREETDQRYTQHTFSACFDEPSLDERWYIEAVVSQTGCTPHHVFPSGERLAKELDTWLWHQEEPVSGFGVYAQYCVARLAQEQGIKVLLDGQGADEQLAGYRKFILAYLRQLVDAGQYLTAGREAMAFFCRPEILRTSRFNDGRRYLLKKFPEIAPLWGPECMPERPDTLGIGRSLGRRLELDLTRYSLPALLRFEDRNMMAFGVESRVPFVDHCLVEWIATLPASLRLSGGWSKRILREALRGILPERVRTRRSKLGFVTPASAWLAGPLAAWLHDTLSSPRFLSDVVDVRGVRQLLSRRAAGDRSLPLEDALFYLAIFETWARQFLGPLDVAGFHDTDLPAQSRDSVDLSENTSAVHHY